MANDNIANRSEPNQPQRSIVENPIVRTLAMGGAGFFALTTATFSIWREFYNEVKGFRPFADYETTRKTAIEAAYKLGETDPSKVPPLVKEAQQASKNAIAAGMRQIGLPEGLFAGTYARARRLELHNFSDIALKTIASLAVALGSWWLFQRSMSQHHAAKIAEHTRRNTLPAHTPTSEPPHKTHTTHKEHSADSDTPSTRVEKHELAHESSHTAAHAAQR